MITARAVLEIPRDAKGRTLQIAVLYTKNPFPQREHICYLRVLNDGWVEYQYSSGTVCTHFIKDNDWPLRVEELHPDIFSRKQGTYPTLREPRKITSIVEITAENLPNCPPGCKFTFDTDTAPVTSP